MVSVRAANVWPKAMAKQAKPANQWKLRENKKTKLKLKLKSHSGSKEIPQMPRPALPCLALPCRYFAAYWTLPNALEILVDFLTIFLNVHLTVHSTQARSAFCSWLMLDWHWRLPSSVFRAIFRIAASNPPILLSYVWWSAQAHKHATPPHLDVYV